MRRIPKGLGACADLLYKTRQRRLATQKKVAAIQELETALTNHIINELPKSKAEGITGRHANVVVMTKQLVKVEDWDAFQQHMAITRDFSLLNRSPSQAAIKERWANGETVPGVISDQIKRLSITKAKGAK